jgi:hypothetical protein
MKRIPLVGPDTDALGGCAIKAKPKLSSPRGGAKTPRAKAPKK